LAWRSSSSIGPTTEAQWHLRGSSIDFMDVALALLASAGAILAVALMSSLFIFVAEIGGHKRPPIYDEAQLAFRRIYGDSIDT
jgi:hypothetical protein